ncbi:MAG: YgiQ family radical SAM protein [bacterium]
MYIPATKKELENLGWDRADIIIVTGDAYVDVPASGTALLGKYLIKKGFRVAVISQPEISDGKDITAMGEPRLFWGVSAGCTDSMVANYTAQKKKRRSDDFTPGMKNTRRPDRATIVYTNLIKRFFPDTVPVVLGGIEASLRRLAHFDFWQEKIRRSVLFDAKADYLVYGMGEKTAFELAEALRDGKDPRNIPGLCYISSEPLKDAITLPSFESVDGDKKNFEKMFMTFYKNTDRIKGLRMQQKHGGRYLVHNSPRFPLEQKDIDEIYDLRFEYDAHPLEKKKGKIKALDTVRFSITTHRGCFGECSFCAVSLHQGTVIESRSEDSVLREIERMSKHKLFRGVISDMGGPTANMYKMNCKKQINSGKCSEKHCLHPEICEKLEKNHQPLVKLMKKASEIENVKHLFIGSGLRHDLILADKKSGTRYLRSLTENHISGQLKFAPEHISEKVLELMKKPEKESSLLFRKKFDAENQKTRKKQYLTCYFIAAHPGCEIDDMKKLRTYSIEKLGVKPRQVQIFTPTPSTISTLIYFTGRNPFNGEEVFVERSLKNRAKQKEAALGISGGKPRKKKTRRSLRKTKKRL